MIELRQIAKVFHRNGQSVHALKEVNLSIEQGEIFGFIGYSGAGKSSLIRLINRLEQPSSGQVLVNGVDIARLNAKQRIAHKKNIGMIFQHFNLLESKTVAQNVALPLILSGVKTEEIEQRVDAILDYVDLKEKKSSYPRQLSGGQKQRVSIARALINNPKILLCDEATSALDPQTTLSILALLKKINREQKITILLVTHEMDVIQHICDRVAVMANGQVIELDSVLNIFSNPQHSVTQKFVNTVLNEQIPENVLQHLESDQHIYRLEFLDHAAKQPVLHELATHQIVVSNVLFANMVEIQGHVVGSMFVQLIGDDQQIHNAVQFLKSRHVRVNGEL